MELNFYPYIDVRMKTRIVSRSKLLGAQPRQIVKVFGSYL